MRVGVDTGGTFTDVVADDGRIVKTPSTPTDPGARWPRASAALEGPPELLAHGTTVATNALLERRGGRVALVTTRGFADVIEIARQDRPSLYDPLGRPARRRSCPRPALRGRRRLDATASRSSRSPGDGSRIPRRSTPIAVCLLHADLNPAHEQAVAAALAGAGFDVTCSHEVSPEFREYERTVTTVANAPLRPRCRPYLCASTRWPTTCW